MNHGKRYELSVIIGQKNIGILGITESWAHEGISNAELNLHGNTLFWKDRIFGVKKFGGGVLLHVINSLTAELLDENVYAKRVAVDFYMDFLYWHHFFYGAPIKKICKITGKSNSSGSVLLKPQFIPQGDNIKSKNSSSITIKKYMTSQRDNIKSKNSCLITIKKYMTEYKQIITFSNSGLFKFL